MTSICMLSCPNALLLTNILIRRSTGSDYCGFSADATFFRIHTALDISCDIMSKLCCLFFSWIFLTYPWKTVFVLPFFPIHNLQLQKRQKYTVYGIFLLGAITIAIGISRCIVINILPLNTPICMRPCSRSSIEAPTSLFSSYWPNWLDIWAAAEYCCSMIVVCLPSLKPLIKSLGDSNSRSADRSHSKRTWSYFKYATEKESVKNGVSTFVNASSRDGSQVQLRNLENGILKTSSITMNWTFRGWGGFCGVFRVSSHQRVSLYIYRTAWPLTWRQVSRLLMCVSSVQTSSFIHYCNGSNHLVYLSLTRYRHDIFPATPSPF